MAALAVGVSVLAALLPATAPARAAAATAASNAGITTVAGDGDNSSTGDGGPAVNAGLAGPDGVLLTASGTDISERGLVRQVVSDGTIHRIAGGGTLQDSPDGTLATRAVLASEPLHITTDAKGNVYFDANASVRKVDAATGRLGTVAGTGAPGYSGDGGLATEAQLNQPRGIALDGHGNMFIADTGNNRIREVDATTRIITTVAGTGDRGFTGDGGPATAAQMMPGQLALDPAGDVVFTDLFVQRVRRIDAATHTVTTIAGGGSGTTDGGPALSALFDCLGGVDLDAAGTGILVTDYCYNQVYRISGGTITIVAGNGFTPVPNLGDGGPATAAYIGGPNEAVPDASGNLFISDTGKCRIRRVDHATGIITTVAGVADPGVSSCPTFSGDGRPALEANIAPHALGRDASGDLLLEDFAITPRIRMIDPSGIISTVVGGSVGDGIPATDAQLNLARGLGQDLSGNLLIADCGDGQVRRVDASGTITVFAGEGSGRHGIGDGGPATDAVLDCPTGVTTATRGPAPGSVYIADCLADVVREVDPSGRITTVAGNGTVGFSGDHHAAVNASLNCPSAVAVDGGGNLYIADQNSNRVREVDTRGVITTVAGDGVFGIGDDGVRAVASHLATPAGLTFDGAGNLFISDGGRVRRVSAAAPGIITTVAGSGIPGFSGDGGPALNAQLAGPSQLQVAPNGDITVADTGNNVVRAIGGGTPPPPPASGCGQLLTQSIQLTADLGPCPGDGIDVGANGITIDLNGHTITGTGVPGGNRAGIRLAGRHHVIVTGYQGSKGTAGQLTGFEDGVAVIGGSDNVLERLNIHDNTGGAAEFGDGIGIFASAGNQILGNSLSNNGPYDGIGMLGQGSDNNLIQANSVANTHTYAGDSGCDGTGVGIILTSFLDVSWPRNQTILNNRVLGNTITNNDTAGISDIGNVDELLRGNTVLGNGVAVPCPGNGIGLQNTFLNNRGSNATVEGNNVHGNGNNGIEIDTDYNTIVDNNAADNNAVVGYGSDLWDNSELTTHLPGCNHNVWSGNVWGSGGYYPNCAAAGGTGPNPPPASSAAVSGAAGAAIGSVHSARTDTPKRRGRR